MALRIPSRHEAGPEQPTSAIPIAQVTNIAAIAADWHGPAAPLLTGSLFNLLDPLLRIDPG
jgi:hypothetical protein